MIFLFLVFSDCRFCNQPALPSLVVSLETLSSAFSAFQIRGSVDQGYARKDVANCSLLVANTYLEVVFKEL